MNWKTQDFEETGRLWLRNLLSENELKSLDQTFPEGSPSQRTPIQASLHHVLGPGGSITQALQELLPNAFPTRAVAFSKSKKGNWGVPWHQDRVIAVHERKEIDQFTEWSLKEGVWHCEPPLYVLKNMLFLRLHLDDDVQGNGAMQIAVGSHKMDRVSASEAGNVASGYPIETCHARRGDVLVLKMLTLHRSAPSQTSVSRRVLRCDYANENLPRPLAWTTWKGA